MPSNSLLYSIKNNKILNTEENLSSKVKVDNKIYYKYNDLENTKLISDNEEVLLTMKKNQKLIVNDGIIMYLENDNATMLDTKLDNVLTYKLKENEKLLDEYGNYINPFRNTLFISNNKSKYIKVVNTSGSIIKEIKDTSLSSVSQSEKTKNIFIITKKEENDKTLYGLYIAK